MGTVLLTQLYKTIASSRFSTFYRITIKSRQTCDLTNRKSLLAEFLNDSNLVFSIHIAKLLAMIDSCSGTDPLPSISIIQPFRSRKSARTLLFSIIFNELAEGIASR